MESKTDIIIVGAGAAGFMAARELSKAGKKVIVLEARDRIGGRIMPLDEKEFGYPVQGGAEFVHGEAKTTNALIKEAGLKVIPYGGEIWSTRSGNLERLESFLAPHKVMHSKLREIVEDLPMSAFMERFFGGEEHADMRNSVIRMIEGYDAADPKRISTLTIRDEWLKKDDWEDGRLEGGYGRLLEFLKNECEKNGVVFVLNTPVKSIHSEDVVKVQTSDRSFLADKAVVTVPLPLLKQINFVPPITENLKAAEKIGFGGVIKIVLKFKDRWWNDVDGKDLSKTSFLISNEAFMSWWTQYPEINNILVGWMAGPRTEKHKNLSDEELLTVGLQSLSKMVGVEADFLRSELQTWKVINWPTDPLTLGAYSYTAYDTKDSYRLVAQPVGDKIFFAGEAYYFTGLETAMVEGALSSGKEVAESILKLSK